MSSNRTASYRAHIVGNPAWPLPSGARRIAPAYATARNTSRVVTTSAPARAQDLPVAERVATERTLDETRATQASGSVHRMRASYLERRGRVGLRGDHSCRAPRRSGPRGYACWLG